MRKLFTTNNSFGVHGRSGVLHTRRGDVQTPTFMPDGTRGAVKGMTPEQVADTGVQVVLANAYHLHLSPGEEVIKKLGGLHVFANRDGPILTDSGGFQVFSLGAHKKGNKKSSDRAAAHQVAPAASFSQSHSLSYSSSKEKAADIHLEHNHTNNKNSHYPKITEDGVEFRDPKTGNKHFITPEKSMQIQLDLGADMIVAFDHLVGLDSANDTDVKDAFDRTHRWLDRCIAEFKRLTADMIGPEDPAYNESANRSARGLASSRSGGLAQAAQELGVRRPLLFGVVQGGLDVDLRKESLRIVQESGVDGIAIGGLSVGETRSELRTVLKALAPLYDPDRPRFLLGVGTPEDLDIAVDNGIDMLDCVLPTRNARHSAVWSGNERMNLSNERFALDTGPIEDGCDCYTCTEGFSRAFLRHQFKSADPVAGTLASIHNLRYMSRLCEGYQLSDGKIES